MRGRAELQSGAVLMLIGAIGLAILRVWTGGFSATPTGTVFAGQSFASGVIAIMLGGVFAIGLLLVALGVGLVVVQRIVDERRKSIPPRGPKSL